MRPANSRWGRRGRRTYVAMTGAIILHGPHLYKWCQRVGVRGERVLPFGEGIDDDELVVPVVLHVLLILVHPAAV